jgi:hypothetical protein
MIFSLFKRSKPSFQRIKDLTVPEIARETTAQFKRSGWSLLTSRLLFRGIELDSHNAALLIGFSEYFNDEPPNMIPRENGLLSGLILSYAFSVKEHMDSASLHMLEGAKLKLLWKWGLAHYVDGDKTRPAPTTMEEHTDVIIDEITFVRVLGQMKSMGLMNTIEDGFAMAHVRLGMRCGALRLKKAKLIDTSYSPHLYRTSPTYESWLLQDSSTLTRSA